MKIPGKLVLGILAIIMAVHVTAIVYDWYTSLWWWVDVVLHTAGGAWIALVFFYAERRYALGFQHISPVFVLILALGFVMLVLVSWEWFEYGFDYFFVKEKLEWRAQLGLPDTMGDLFSDFVGGLLVSLYFVLKRGYSFTLNERK